MKNGVEFYLNIQFRFICFGLLFTEIPDLKPSFEFK